MPVLFVIAQGLAVLGKRLAAITLVIALQWFPENCKASGLGDEQAHGDLIGVKDLLHSGATPQAIVFLDVREMRQFRLAHIPGSINLPLYQIKGKSYLRAKPLVLLNQGASHKELLQEADRMRKLGFASVNVLEGGIRAWQAAGGPLEGDHLHAPELGELTAAQFYLSRNEPGWLLIGVLAGSEMFPPSPLEPAAFVHLDPERLDRELKEAIRPRSGAKRIVLVTAKGQALDQIAAGAEGCCSLPVFQLVGGAEGYARYSEQRLALTESHVMTVSSQPRTSSFNAGPRSTGRTGRCCGGN